MASNKILMAAGIAGAILAGPISTAAIASPDSMPIMGRTSQPIGHNQFCRKYVNECRRKSSSAPAKLTRHLWKRVQDINNDVNLAVRPLTDHEIWGVQEHWSYPGSVGDCEDYVLEKQRLLMQAGVSPGNLLITVVRQRNGDGHAVLTLRTDIGDFILDNLEPRVLPWKKTSYTYLKRQSSRHSGKWVSIDDSRNMTVGSVK